MSQAVIRWARARCLDPDAPRLTEGERYLLIVLATYHSEIGDAWPTVPELAALMGFSDRRIQQLSAGLEAKGCLTRDSRGGRGHATAYTLALPVKGEIKGERVQLASPFDEGLKGERVKSAARKGEILKGERVQLASPFGGTIGGSTSPSSLPFPTVTLETTENTGRETKETAAFAVAATTGAQALCSVLAAMPGFEPSPAFVRKLGDKYGRLDLEEEALKMAAWLRQHKKRQCSTAFVLNWLGRKQEEPPGQGGKHERTGATAGSRAREPDPYDRWS